MASFVEWLDERTIPEPNSGCLIWLRFLNPSGYGYARDPIRKKPEGAHRIAWRHQCGEIPGDLHVLHKCDNRTCVNVDHLFLGTNSDNTRDRDRKGRGARHDGIYNGQARLSPAQVKEIRSSKDRLKLLSAKFGVSETQVSRIRLGRNWRSL